MSVRALIVTVVTCLCFPSPAAAQPPLGSGGRGSFPGCPQCGVWGWVDYPRPLRDPLDVLLGVPIDMGQREDVSASNFWAMGWGFECVSGQPIDRADVFYQDYAGLWRPLKQPASALRAIDRPDVVRFGPTVNCATPTRETGWALQIVGMPVGLRRVRIDLWWGPYVDRREFTLLVKP